MKPGEKFLPEDFRLTESTLAWVAEKHPTLDVPDTLERFCDNAAAKSWAYRDWQAAFRNYVRNGKLYGGVTYKQGRMTTRCGPLFCKTPASSASVTRTLSRRLPATSTQLMLWRQSPATASSNVRSLREALRSVK
jgi:hypothetical protein